MTHGLDVSTEADAYRDYIAASRGEFTVAKDQNVRLRTGWFSDRSATYLAAGRPVISQETGFSNIFPTGEGLHGFSTMEEIVEAVERTNADYARHSRRAAEIAREYFSHEVVLGRLLAEVGEELPGRRGRLAPARSRAVPAGPGDSARRRGGRRGCPTQRSRRCSRGRCRPFAERPQPARGRLASIVMVSYDNLVFTRLAIETRAGEHRPSLRADRRRQCLAATGRRSICASSRTSVPESGWS